MLVIAHRGARGIAPENTLAAIEAAERCGADAVEIDVHLSRDGEAVVTHDDRLVRCTDAHRRFPDRAPWWVSDFTLAELRTLDAGSWFAQQLAGPRDERQMFLQSLTPEEQATWISADDVARFGSGTIGIPTLAECLALCTRLGLGLNVELKVIPRFQLGLVDRVLEVIEASGQSERVMISSFDHRRLKSVRGFDPDIRIAALSRDGLADPLAYLKALDAQAWHPGCMGDDDLVGLQAASGTPDIDTIAALRAEGIGVNVWTMNDPAGMQRLIDAGVTGIFTDYPHRLRAVLDERARPGDRP